MRATEAVIFDLSTLDDASGTANMLTMLSRDDLPIAVVGHRDSIEALGSVASAGHVSIFDLGPEGTPPDFEAALQDAALTMGIGPANTAFIGGEWAGFAIARRGGFGLIIGVDADDPQKLVSSGADLAVTRVTDLGANAAGWFERVPGPRSALRSIDDVILILGNRPAVFLDYDGTLTPLVDDPADATIGPREREMLRHLSHRTSVAVVSGRGLDDVRSLVGVDGLFYAGSHGFEIESPDGKHFEHRAAVEVLADLDEAQRLLEQEVTDLDGVVVERKRFAIAVHTRRASSRMIRMRAGHVTADVASRFDRLRLTGGKEIHELRPAVAWDKGAALIYVLDFLPGHPKPLYIGDDETDEDAFLTVRKQVGGVGILVGSVDSAAETWADFSLDSPEETVEFLTELTAGLG